jgi:hypothetical protein
MDLSGYISELLSETGTISIPQIGVFRQIRVHGYFNADEGKLYPPSYQIQFEQQPVTDDTLLQYITAKSKVSASSAKYFVDRYLHNILQQAEIGEVMLGRLGWLSRNEDHTLQFRPAVAQGSQVAGFGFTPVALNPEPIVEEPLEAQEQETAPVPPVVPTNAPVYSVEKEAAKTGTVIPDGPITATSPLLRQRQRTAEPAQPAPAPVEPVSTQPPVTPPAPGTGVPVQPIATPEKPFYLKPWFLGIAAALLVGVLAVLFYPQISTGTAGDDADDKTAAASSAMPSMDSVVVKTPVKADTAAQNIPVTTPVADTTASKPAPLPASTEFAPEVETPAKNPVSLVLTNPNFYRFVLMSGAFGNEAEAVKVVNRYRSRGLKAGIVKNVSPSRYIKVGLGYYKTYALGQAAKQQLVKQYNLRSGDLYVETIRNK